MALWEDERAQPVQIGFIFVFALLIISFSVYQAVFVPQQNAEIEYNHYQQVGQDMADLRNGLLSAAGSNSDRSVSVKLGTSYPARVFALNPPPPSGTLATTGAGAVNVTGLSKNATELCADPATTNGVESRSLTYRPSYNEYGAAESITYENSFVVRSFRDGARYGPQNLVEEAGGGGANRINLQLLTNEFSESGTGTASVDLETSRTYEETFSLSTGESFSIIVPSRFSVDTWRTEILDDIDAYRSIQPEGDRIEITFGPGDYTISCTAVGLNQRPAYQPPAVASGDVDNSPTASIDYLEDTSDPNPPTGPGFAEYNVGWNVTDDNGLDSLTIQLLDSSGNVVDSVTPAVGGTSASGEATLRERNGDGARYVVKVIVTDSSGQTDTESVTDFADGE